MAATVFGMSFGILANRGGIVNTLEVGSCAGIAFYA